MKFLIINFLFLLLTTPVFIYLMGARQNIIIFQIFYAISTVYYGVFGIWYWIEYHGGVFLGNNWSLMLNDISNIFIYTYIMVSFLVLGMSKIEIYPNIILLNFFEKV